MTGMGDSIAGPDVCSPDVYRRWAWPYEREVVATLAAEGMRIGLHICGDATRIVSDMVETGSQLLAVDYKIDLAAAKQAAQRGDDADRHDRPQRGHGTRQRG